MVNNAVRGRGRIVGSLAATMALLGSAAFVASGPAQAAPPEDCTTPADIGALNIDDTVHGLTVVQGTTPQAFNGTFKGVIENGIAPGVDMVMVEVDPSGFTGLSSEVHGIWQGMSGSPVYDASNNLIGAVAYGLGWGNSWVAGVTPFDQMDDYMDQTFAAHVKMSPRVAKKIARTTDANAAEAASGFSRLKIPFGISGISGTRFHKALAAQKDRKARYLRNGGYQMAGAAAGQSANVDPDSVFAGGNLAAAMSYGDIAITGTGTATSVCDGRVVGFGHPFNFSGKTTMSLHPADVLYVQGDDLGAPFKVSNMGDDPIGTITDDHMTGITGTFGPPPAAMDVSSTVSYPGRTTREGISHVPDPDVAPDVTFFAQLANHDAVLDGIVKGSELQDWTITGTDDGTPFTLQNTERYASSWDIAFEAPWDVADIVWALSNMEGVTIDDVTINGAVDDNFSRWHMSTVEAKQGGTWTKVTRRGGVVAHAGKDLALRVTLKDGDDTLTRTLSVGVPKSASGKRGYLVVFGGASDWFWAGGANSVAGLQTQLANNVRNDAVGARMVFRSHGKTVQRKAESNPTDQVVTGQTYTSLEVRLRGSHAHAPTGGP